MRLRGLESQAYQLWNNDPYLSNFVAGECSHRNAHRAAIGLVGNRFRTTALAAYPAALCSALSSALVHAFSVGCKHGRALCFECVDGPWRPIFQSRAFLAAGPQGKEFAALDQHSHRIQN